MAEGTSNQPQDDVQNYLGPFSRGFIVEGFGDCLRLKLLAWASLGFKGLGFIGPGGLFRQVSSPPLT